MSLRRPKRNTMMQHFISGSLGHHGSPTCARPPPATGFDHHGSSSDWPSAARDIGSPDTFWAVLMRKVLQVVAESPQELSDIQNDGRSRPGLKTNWSTILANLLLRSLSRTRVLACATCLTATRWSGILRRILVHVVFILQSCNANGKERTQPEKWMVAAQLYEWRLQQTPATSSRSFSMRLFNKLLPWRQPRVAVMVNEALVV